MNKHLCLKWNNHSSAFLRSIRSILSKERFCDATIVCEGRYFPVHRIVLTTCSEYFDEIFDRMQCQHPYIIFKEITSRDMELLLNYMYHGEVNVAQDLLPAFIKAAEFLKIKGLAVPDEETSSKKDLSSERKRNKSCVQNNHTKGSSDEHKRQKISLQSGSQVQVNDGIEEFSHVYSEEICMEILQHQSEDSELKTVKAEPIEADFAINTLEDTSGDVFHADDLCKDDYLISGPNTDSSELQIIKTEPPGPIDESLNEQIPWSEFNTAEGSQNFSSSNFSGQSNIIGNMNAETVVPESRFVISTNVETDETNCARRASRKHFKCTYNGMLLCPYCNYVSRNAANVRRHIMHKHTGERPFACSICSSRFTEKVSLNRHMKTHVRGKLLQCNFCSKKFKSREGMKLHIIRNHSNEKE